MNFRLWGYLINKYNFNTPGSSYPKQSWGSSSSSTNTAGSKPSLGSSSGGGFSRPNTGSNTGIGGFSQAKAPANNFGSGGKITAGGRIEYFLLLGLEETFYYFRTSRGRGRRNPGISARRWRLYQTYFGRWRSHQTFLGKWRTHPTILGKWRSWRI